jgi:tetratricopeptide (TPR) repeat protein
MMKFSRFAFLAVLMFFAVNLQAQAVDSLIVQGKKLIAEALNKWDAAKMQKARAHFERLLAGKKHEALLRYYLGYCDYRLVIFHQQKKNAEMMKKHLDEAINHLEAAVKLNNKSADFLQPAWGHEEAYAWIGVAYLDKNDKAAARAAFERALAIAPAYGWVKYQLYPKVVEAKESKM